MRSDEVDTILNEFFAEELRQAPRRHSQETDECPSLLRFPAGVRSGWRSQPDDRSHVTSCRLCQKVTAMQWRLRIENA